MRDFFTPEEVGERWSDTWESYAAFGSFLSPQGPGPGQVDRWRVVHRDPRDVANDWTLALARAYRAGSVEEIVGFEDGWPTRAQAEDDLRRVGELTGQAFREPVIHDGVKLVDGNHRVAAAIADGRPSIRVLVPV